MSGVEEHESERMRSAELLCGTILFLVQVQRIKISLALKLCGLIEGEYYNCSQGLKPEVG